MAGWRFPNGSVLIKISFDVGRWRKINGKNITPFTGELGGKSPLIIFPDADLEVAVAKAVGQFDDSGQICLAGTRLLVHSSIKKEFLKNCS
mgnify:CR=1 FL=1